MKKIYLAGAMGCYNPNDEYPYKWRKEATEKIKTSYGSFQVVNPCDFYKYGESYHKSEKEVMKFDLRLVKNSDVVLVNLKDIDKSLGTSDEILYAYLHDIPVIGFFDGKYYNLHPWKNEQIDRVERTLDDAIKYITYYYY